MTYPCAVYINVCLYDLKSYKTEHIIDQIQSRLDWTLME